MMAKTGNTSLNASKTDAASSRQEEECLQEQILVDDWEAGIDGANAGSSEDEQDSSASGESDDDDDLNMDEDENDGISLYSLFICQTLNFDAVLENRLPLSAKKDKTPKRPLGTCHPQSFITLLIILKYFHSRHTNGKRTVFGQETTEQTLTVYCSQDCCCW